MAHPIGTLVRIDALDEYVYGNAVSDLRLYKTEAPNLFDDVTIDKIYQIVGSDDGDEYFIDDAGDRNYCACSDGSGFALFTVMPSNVEMPTGSPLTKDKIKDLLLNMPANYSMLKLVRIIEKAHGIV